MKSCLLILATLVALTGCSSSVLLTEKSDWYSIGYRDGLKGHTSRSYKDLAEYGQFNLIDYDQGYLAGVKEYCDPSFAYQIGLSGSYYEGVCEGMPEAQKFRMEWHRGWNQGSGRSE